MPTIHHPLSTIHFCFLAQIAPTASTVFFITILFIFATAVVTTILTNWTRDKCLKFFHHYHVTVERSRGQTSWGKLKVFSNGMEIVYDHAYVDSMGRKKSSFLLYSGDLDQQVHSVLRYHDELEESAQLARRKQVDRTFNPGPFRRLWRGFRNLINTLRDGFNAAIGAVVGQYQRMNPSSAILATQGQSVTQMGQTILGQFANAYEPLLEQYIGQPVILDVADPINPNHFTVQYTGYLADYTQKFVAIFNVQHRTEKELTVTLPDVQEGDALAPLPPPPAPGTPPVELPRPLKVENYLAIRIDGVRFKITNTWHDAIVVRKLQREGFEPFNIGMVIPPNGTLDLPARDSYGATLTIELIRCLDVVAPRRCAVIRHAGELVERPGIFDDLHIDHLPLVPLLFHNHQTPPEDDKVTR